MCDDEEIEVIDLDAEDEFTPDGINRETSEYDPCHDAWYPNFDALAKAEIETFGKRTF